MLTSARTWISTPHFKLLLKKFHGTGLSKLGSISSSLMMPITFSRSSEAIQTEEACDSRSYWDQIWTKYLIPKGTKSDLNLRGPKPKINVAFFYSSSCSLKAHSFTPQLKILLVMLVHEQKWVRELMAKYILIIVCCFLIAWEILDTITARSLKHYDR